MIPGHRQDFFSCGGVSDSAGSIFSPVGDSPARVRGPTSCIAARLTISLPRAYLLEQSPQPRQLDAIKAGGDIGLRDAPIGQSTQQDRLPFFRQTHLAFARITSRGKRDQSPRDQTLDIARDRGGIAIQRLSQSLHCRRAEVMRRDEQTELRRAQTSAGERHVIRLGDSARRRAHGETDAIAAFIQLR
jgi:hypothetical protein